MHEFAGLLETLSVSAKDHLLLVGDFNFHVDDPLDDAAKCFLHLLETWNLSQHVQLPTHDEGHTLDLVITRTDDVPVSISGTDSCVSSDHACVLFTLRIVNPQKTLKTMTIRKLGLIHPAAFSEDFSVLLQDSSSSSTSDCEPLYKKYCGILSSLIDKHAPLRQVTITTKAAAPWFNYSVRTARRRCRKSERKWRATGLPEHRAAFVHEHSSLNKTRRSAKQAHLQQRLSSASSAKEMHRVADSLMNGHKPIVLPSATDDRDLAQRFNSFFSDKVQNIRSSIVHPADHVGQVTAMNTVIM